MLVLPHIITAFQSNGWKEERSLTELHRFGAFRSVAQDVFLFALRMWLQDYQKPVDSIAWFLDHTRPSGSTGRRQTRTQIHGGSFA